MMSAAVADHLLQIMNGHSRANEFSNQERINVHADQPTRAEVIRALGLDVIPPRQLAKIPVRGMEQGIPPAFTRFIAELAIPEKVYVA